MEGSRVNFAFKNSSKGNTTTAGSRLEINSSPVNAVSKLPVVYSQSSLIRNQMAESEPLSEYSEPPMLPTRALPPPFQRMLQAQTQIGQMEMQALTTRTVSFCQELRDTPYRHNLASHFIPPPTPPLPPSPQLQTVITQRMSSPSQPASPQCYVPKYNPDQTFIMQSTSPSTSATIPAKARIPSTSTLTSSPLGKIINEQKNSQRTIKLNSVTRRRFFVSSVEQLARWHKISKKVQINAVYEIPAILDSLSRNPAGVYHLILRGERNNTLPLQAVYFPIDRELPKVNIGDLITCVGRMVGTNKLQVYDMWATNPDNLAGLKRTAFLCQRTLQETDLADPEP